MKKLLMPAALVVLAAVVRVVFYITGPGYWTTPDTQSYFGTAQNIVRTHSVVDQWRTPVYPLILATPFILERKHLPDSYAGVILPEFLAVRIAQSVLGIITVVFFYLTLCHIGVKRSISWIFGLVVSLSWPLLMYEDILITESFSLFLLVLTMFTTVSALKRWQIGKGVALIILFITGVFLRPSTILLPFVIISVMVWFIRKRIVTVWAVTAVCIYGISLSMYGTVNGVQNGYPGISRISDVNLLGKILQYQLPVTNARNSELKKMVSPYLAAHVTDPWIIMNNNPQLYEARYTRALQKFVTDVLKQNSGTYVERAVLQIPSAMQTPQIYAEYAPVDHFSNNFFGILKQANEIISKGYLLIFIVWPYYVYKAITKRNLYAVCMTLFWCTGMYYIIGSVFLSYGDYGRLILAAQPLLLVVSYIWMFELLRVIIWGKQS